MKSAKRGPKSRYSTILTKKFLYQRYVLERKSQPQIAAEIGCAKSLVGKYLKKHTIPTRSISDSKIGILNSPETRAKISRALKGKLVGTANPFFGRHHSEETKKKLSIANSGKKRPHTENSKRKISQANKGKKLSKETKEKLRQARLGRKLTEETKRKISAASSRKNNPMWGKPRPDMLGSNNPSWKGGTTKLIQKIRTCVQYNIWRQKVYKRDNYTCQECGSNVSNTLNADHIIPISYIVNSNNITSLEEARKCPDLWAINNGRTLCEQCHKQTDTWGHKATKFGTIQ